MSTKDPNTIWFRIDPEKIKLVKENLNPKGRRKYNFSSASVAAKTEVQKRIRKRFNSYTINANSSDTTIRKGVRNGELSLDSVTLLICLFLFRFDEKDKKHQPYEIENVQNFLSCLKNKTIGKIEDINNFNKFTEKAIVESPFDGYQIRLDSEWKFKVEPSEQRGTFTEGPVDPSETKYKNSNEEPITKTPTYEDESEKLIKPAEPIKIGSKKYRNLITLGTVVMTLVILYSIGQYIVNRDTNTIPNDQKNTDNGPTFKTDEDQNATQLGDQSPTEILPEETKNSIASDPIKNETKDNVTSEPSEPKVSDPRGSSNKNSLPNSTKSTNSSKVNNTTNNVEGDQFNFFGRVGGVTINKEDNKRDNPNKDSTDIK